jgi:UDP-MurNAc hydroxylase
MTQITFVNHASFIVDTGDVRMIMDPWIEGRVFHEGWELLAPTKFRYDDFRSITHIFFSHEHPDHFFPPNVKRIPEDARKNIEVLYQETADRKVAKFCREAGFAKVTEIPPGRWVKIADDVEIWNEPLGTHWAGDSWLAVRTKDATILNLNDCGVAEKDARAIKEKIGRVDLLATQFSYAAWQGNPADDERRRENARDVLRDVESQIRVLEPRWVLPFASFVWFCAEENFYLNADMNKIRDVAKLIDGAGANPLVLSPGDSWTIGETHDPLPALEVWEKLASEIGRPDIRPPVKRPTIAAKTLIEDAAGFRKRLFDVSNAFLVRAYLAYDSYRNDRRFGVPRWKGLLGLFSMMVRPVAFWVTDLDMALMFDVSHGLTPAPIAPESCDMKLSSAALDFCFKFPFGGETLQINGCFRENDKFKSVPPWSYPGRFFLFTRLARRVDLGYRLTWRRVIGSVLSRFRLAKE